MRFSTAASRRGAAALMAMLYLLLFSTLTVAMFTMATLNTQTAANYSDADHARATAESGLRWIQYRFMKMDRPKTTIGNITPAVASNLWPGIRSSITADLNTLTKPTERPVTFTNNHLLTSWVSVDETGGRFQVDVTPEPKDRTNLIVASTGKYKNSLRTISMKFHIDKKLKFAIAGKVPIQLGRNVVVEGPEAMTTSNRYPPMYSLSDF